MSGFPLIVLLSSPWIPFLFGLLIAFHLIYDLLLTYWSISRKKKKNRNCFHFPHLGYYFAYPIAIFSQCWLFHIILITCFRTSYCTSHRFSLHCLHKFKFYLFGIYTSIWVLRIEIHILSLINGLFFFSILFRQNAMKRLNDDLE